MKFHENRRFFEVDWRSNSIEHACFMIFLSLEECYAICATASDHINIQPIWTESFYELRWCRKSRAREQRYLNNRHRFTISDSISYSKNIKGRPTHAVVPCAHAINNNNNNLKLNLVAEWLHTIFWHEHSLHVIWATWEELAFVMLLCMRRNFLFSDYSFM